MVAVGLDQGIEFLLTQVALVLRTVPQLGQIHQDQIGVVARLAIRGRAAKLRLRIDGLPSRKASSILKMYSFY